jgi:phosphoribosylaminoimidazole (AIR) synthetase
MKQPTAYSKAGVNVTLGDKFSAFCGSVCRSTHGNSPFVRVRDFSEHFRGRRGYEFVGLPPGTIMSAGCDGIGSKVIAIDAAGKHRTAGRDLLAMPGGDFTRDGGLGLIVLNDLNVAYLGENEESPAFLAAQELMLGLATAANEQGYVLFGGETAELKDGVTSENPHAILKFNWGATMIGAIHPNKIITGENVRIGNRVISLRDKTRSNGHGLIRRGLRALYDTTDTAWYDSLEKDAIRDISEVACPSALYDRFFAELNGWTTPDFEPIIVARLIAHLSGGGIQSKFGDDKLFPMGLSAKLPDLWEPPLVTRRCVNALKVSDVECYESLGGCGQGALVVVDEKDADKFLTLAEEAEIEATDAGYICKTKSGKAPTIELRSGFTGRTVVLKPKG